MVFSVEISSPPPLTHTHTLTGEVVGKLCEACGVSAYLELEGILVTGVRYNLERDKEVVGEHPQLVDKLGTDGRPSSPSALNERVSVCVCVCVCVLVCSYFLQPLLLFDSVTNSVCLYVNAYQMRSVFESPSSSDLSSATVETHWPVVAQALARGLADNRSQVRTSFCVVL